MLYYHWHWSPAAEDKLVGADSAAQRLLFADVEESIRDSRASTFVDNMRLPVHRWYRYSAGFSAQWAENVISEFRQTNTPTVFDPFAGAGTTLLAAEKQGAPCYGVEAHPFVARVARAKLLYRTDADAYLAHIREVKKHSRRLRGLGVEYPPLIRKCFTAEALEDLDHLRRGWGALRDKSPASELTWLTLVGILRAVSHAGTAPWQYVLPRKAKKSPLQPLTAFDRMTRIIHVDMQGAACISGERARYLEADARTCAGMPDDSVDLVITSPPYANNYDYADATRLEMCFFGEIKGWGDLQQTVRERLMRSCSQHVPEKAVDLESVLSAAELGPIHREIYAVCRQLGEIRQQKGGKKTYHLMVACYFLDMAQVWKSLRRVCKRPSRLCFVIGDSAPYGVYVPVVEWIGALAQAAGFKHFRFEKTRDRNVKWKNRKHRVPLCEGRLWVDG